MFYRGGSQWAGEGLAETAKENSEYPQRHERESRLYMKASVSEAEHGDNAGDTVTGIWQRLMVGVEHAEDRSRIW